MATSYRDKSMRPAPASQAKRVPANTSPISRSPIEKSPEKSIFGSSETKNDPLAPKRIAERPVEHKAEIFVDPLAPRIVQKRSGEKIAESGVEKNNESPVERVGEGNSERNEEASRVVLVQAGVDEAPKEEAKRAIINDNLLVEKCNAALLLLLEQSDE